MVVFIGYIAAFLTTVSFLPQTIKTYKTKDTGGISLPMYLMFNLGVLFWLIYGIINKDAPLAVANFFTFVFAFPVLLLKLKYK